MVSRRDEHTCKQGLLSVLDEVERLVKPAYEQCVHDGTAHMCEARRDAFKRCKRSGKYPDDTRDCDAAFDVVLSPYKKILSLARIMYKRSPHSDVTPTAGILLDMCKAKWEAEYLGPPPGCKKGQRCDFTPILRDCQENMFIAMKKLHHEECDDPRDTNYDC